MDRANSYVAGSRHKDNCHWFFNNQELRLLSDHYEMHSLAKAMSTDKKKKMAIEYIENNSNAIAKKHYGLNISME